MTVITEVPLSKLLPPDSKPALFAQRALATFQRCKEIFSNRGDQYGDTWRDCQWLKLKAILFTLFGMKPTQCQCRAMALAVLADVKYSRFLGGYNEDHILDGMNYDGALAEEMREVYKEGATPGFAKPSEAKTKPRKWWVEQDVDGYWHIGSGNRGFADLGKGTEAEAIAKGICNAHNDDLP